MLEGLDSVDWSSVRHAYGAAIDIPPLLQALRSANAAERQETIEVLDNLIHHQGTLYEAAVQVAPFLVELLVAPDTPDRENIAALFALLAEDKQLEDYSDEEREWAASLRDIVERNIHLIYPYLESKEPTIRWIIASSVALFPNQSIVSLPYLERAFDAEEKEDVKEGLKQAILKLKSQRIVS